MKTRNQNFLIALALSFCLLVQADAKGVHALGVREIAEQMAESRDMKDFARKIKLMPAGKEEWKGDPKWWSGLDKIGNGYREGVLRIRTGKKNFYTKSTRYATESLAGDYRNAYFGVYSRKGKIYGVEVHYNNYCLGKDRCRMQIQEELKSKNILLTRITKHCHFWDKPADSLLFDGLAEVYRIRFKDKSTVLYLISENDFFTSSVMNGRYELVLTYERPDYFLKRFECE